METFVVERYLPGWDGSHLTRLVDRLAVADFGPGVHYRGTIVVAGDEACLCLFDADTAEAVRSANLALGLPVSRVVAASVVSGLPWRTTPHGP